MDWSYLDYLWITVMFYQLFGLSFWRHPFTAEDLLVSNYNAKLLQINKLILDVDYFDDCNSCLKYLSDDIYSL